MRLKDFFSYFDKFKSIQGVEAQLRRRRRNGLLATLGTILVGIIEIIRGLSEDETIIEYLSRVLDATSDFFVFAGNISLYPEWEFPSGYEIAFDVLGFYILFAGIFIFILYKHTSFLFKISEEPFQYTFWIEPFKKAGKNQANNDTKDSNSKENPKLDLNLDHELQSYLHHDLMNMLNRRIGRFTLLDEEYLNKKSGDSDNTDDSDYVKIPPSHIHVAGVYANRYWKSDTGKETNGKEDSIIQVMPRVRIGPPGNPSTLTYSIEVEKEGEDQNDTQNNNSKKSEIYNQVLEQVYSKVASEIYTQIRLDLKEKINLFPTKYLRAVALYYEAEDFVQSNTIDSYDYAIELYQESLRYYDVSFRSVLSNLLLYLPWPRLGIDYELMCSKTRIGYARCLIYRRIISSLTGLNRNPLFGVPLGMNKVVSRLIRIHNKFHIWREPISKEPIKTRRYQNKHPFWIGIIQIIDGLIELHNKYHVLKIRQISESTRSKSEIERFKFIRKKRRSLNKHSLTFNKDTWFNKYVKRKLDTSKFEKVKKLLFDTYVVLALAYARLDAIKKAKDNLDNAKAVYPGKCESETLFLLAKADTELVLELKTPLLIHATENSPIFEIAQYQLAQNRLELFLFKGELSKERAKQVIKEFENVLKINPGNIAALSQLGYLYWIIDELALAEKQFKRGILSKAISQKAFVGDLKYGLAKVAAEKGDFNTCYNLYSESLSSEPGLAAFSTESINNKPRQTHFYKFISSRMLTRYENFKIDFENHIRAALMRFNVHEIEINNEFREKLISEMDKYGNYFIEENSESEKSNQIYSLSKNEILAGLNRMLKDLTLHTQLVDLDKSLIERIKHFKEKPNFEKGNKALIVQLNRVILEIHFQNWISPNKAEENLSELSFPEKLFEYGEIPFSVNVLKNTYSFILNDYGNALLNYYHRYGNIEQLKKAIQAFNDSKKLNPHNGPVYYNLHNAEYWYKKSNDLQPESSGYLEKADRFTDSPWPIAIIGHAKEEIIKIRNQIRSERKIIDNVNEEVNDLRREIENLKTKSRSKESSYAVKKSSTEYKIENGGESVKKSSENDKQNPDKKGFKGHEIRSKETPEEFSYSEDSTIDEEISDTQDGMAITKQNQLRLDSKEREHKTKSNTLVELKSNIKILEIKFKEVFENSLEKIINLSQFKGIIESSGISVTGEGVDEFIRSQIPIDNFSIQDVNALMYWADLLNYSNNIQGLEAGRNLSVFLNKFVPSNFDIEWNLYQAYHNIDLLKNKKSYPLFNSSDIVNPNKLLMEIKDSFFPKKEFIDFKELIDKEKNDSLKTNLVEYLNKFIYKNLEFKYKDILNSNSNNNFSNRIIELLLLGVEQNYKHFRDKDFSYINRKLLEELFPEEIKKNEMGIYRERICEMVLFWIKIDPVHFLTLSEWVKNYLIFPEANIYLKCAINSNPENKAAYILIQADLYSRFKQIRKAKSILEDAIKEDPDKGIYHLKLSELMRKEQKFNEAREELKLAIDKKILEHKEIEFEKELKKIIKDESVVCRAKSRDLQQAEKLYKEASEKLPDDKELHRDLRELINELRIEKIYGEKWIDQLLVVTPIAMEVAADLIPFVEKNDGGLADMLLELINEMRERIFNGLGVRIPGIRFRGNDYDLPDGTYVMMLNEVPLVSGNISQNHRIFSGSRNEIQVLGIKGEEVQDPVSGKAIYWIEEKDIEKAKGLDDKFWPVMEFPIRHLEAFLHQNLVNFLGHQEVYSLIREKCPDKLSYYDNNPADLTNVTAVLRGLASEKVSIASLSVILEYIEQHRDDSVVNLINGIRMLHEVRKMLPGNRDIKSIYSLGSQIKKEFQSAQYEENGELLLKMLPEPCQEVLTSVRNVVRHQKDEAIIVDNQQLRLLVSQLLKLEFPDLAIIAKNEWLTIKGNGSEDVNVIELT